MPDRLSSLAGVTPSTRARPGGSELADEQAALRRVATLVAQRAPESEVFAAIAREAGQLLGADATHMGRYEDGDMVSVVGDWSRTGERLALIGARTSTRGDSVTARVRRTSRPARMESYDTASGEIAEVLKRAGVRSAAAAPIVVNGRLWGVLVASYRRPEPLPPDAEGRIAAFTELAATAISNTDSWAKTRTLADEQAALRRVATLVARGASPSDLFITVAEEAARLFGTDMAGLIRFDPDDTVALVGIWSATGAPPDIPDRVPLDAGGLASKIARTRRSARIDDWTELPGPIPRYVREELGARSSVGSPIVVDGRLWGALVLHGTRGPALPAGVESRLEHFTELVETAIANSEARVELRRLADEQAALRRVATLVARESPPAELFAAVAAELGHLLRVEGARIWRYGRDASATVVAAWGTLYVPAELGARIWPPEHSIAARVARSGRAARVDDYEATGPAGAAARDLGIRAAVGTPIIVDGRLWGAVVLATTGAAPLPADTETRVGRFTELVATAISNVQARSELAASRARIVAATDEERRRVVRELHDGAQQRLLHTVSRLELAQREGGEAAELVAGALEEAERAMAELRELAHGILPPVLARGGLRAGVDALAARMSVPVENGVPAERLPRALEATAYFVVAEALTNVAKHAGANGAEVTASVDDGVLHVEVRDDGVGGARSEGPGLVGLGDRLAALDGALRVESATGEGTLVAADIPVGPRRT
jgi:GAF domain-containing protein